MGYRSLTRVVAIIIVAAGLAGCGPKLKPPTLRVDSIAVKGLRLTGVGLDVRFQIRNTNPDDLLIEKFEYELELNGKALGRGYYTDAVRLRGFGEAELTSRFDLDFLKLPAGIKAILERDEVDAEANGTFYVVSGDKSARLPFHGAGRVPLR